MFGIGHDAAYALMPYVGVADICFGLIILFYPLRIVFGWLVVWGTFTALLRPLSGEPFCRIYGTCKRITEHHLALLCVAYSKENNWLRHPITPKHMRFNETSIKHVKMCLQVVVFLLFIGHGWLNLIEKKSLLDQYHSLGFSNAANVAHIVGSFEILAAFTVLIRPLSSVLIILFVWKITTELLSALGTL